MKLNVELFEDLQTRKILRDLWGNKPRTTLVILTIAIGVYAVGTISRAWVILSSNLTDNYLAVDPASATISTAGVFDDSFVESVRRMPEVETAEGRNDLVVRVQVGADRWHLLRLIVRADYDRLSLDKIQTETGAWPPPRQSMLLERSSLDLVELGIGDTATIQLPDGTIDEIPIAGVVHDLTQTPTDFTYTAYGYVTDRTLFKLNGANNYNKLDIIVANQPLDKRHIQDVVEQVVTKMETNGMVVVDKEIPNPGVHQLNDIIQSVLQLLVILTVLAVLLGTFLVVNIISALLAQQVQQIGAIKAIGGRSRGIATMYLKTIIILGIVALFTAVPLGMIASRLSAVFVANFINFDITDYYIPPPIYALEIATGILLPCLAALYPIISGTRITVREAIQQSGIQSVQFGTGGFEELLNKMQGLPPIVLYAFRNIFRRKVRLALATLTLSIAGAVFISVISVRASLLVTIDEVATYWQEDVMLGFYRAHRFSRVEQALADIPDISAVEGRLVQDGFRVRPDGRESTQQIKLFGLDPDSRFLKPTLLAGRWLQPDDQNSVVVNVDLLELEPDIKAGDEVTFRTERRETTWHVVGIVTSQVIGGGDLLKVPIAYANYPQLAKTVGQVGEVNRLLIGTNKHDATSDAAMIKSLEDALQQADMRVVFSLLNSDVRQSLRSSFAIIINLVQLMSLLFALVGGLGLMSMMSLNVLERTQEIGIIRVVGGIGAVITQIVIIESIVVGLLSWLVGSLLAFPVSKMMSSTLGKTMLNVPLTHVFPWQGLALWLVIILILAVLASIIPARNASRLVIRETLSYE
jgi:putative ABC transport system permease protein